MRKSALLLMLFLTATPLIAATVVSDEDRTRFVERLYDRAEPGLRSPEEYIALAKKTVTARYPRVAFVDFNDGVVTYRTYRNAPKAEHEMICVNFAHRSNSSGERGHLGGTQGFLLMGNNKKFVLLVLMRRDLSKIYIKAVHLKST